MKKKTNKRKERRLTKEKQTGEPFAVEEFPSRIARQS